MKIIVKNIPIFIKKKESNGIGTKFVDEVKSDSIDLSLLDPLMALFEHDRLF